MNKNGHIFNKRQKFETYTLYGGISYWHDTFDQNLIDLSYWNDQM